MIATAGLLLWNSPLRSRSAQPQVPIPTAPVSLEGLPALGDDTAPVGVVVVSDFECPYCGRFANETLPLIHERFIETGTVKLAFRHLPLPNHSRARSAAQAAECSRTQGLFWQMHDLLFAPPLDLSDQTLTEHASAIGVEGFDTCFASAAGNVDRDIAFAQELQVRVTPTFFVGRYSAEPSTLTVDSVVTGAQPLSEFEERIRDSMARQR